MRRLALALGFVLLAGASARAETPPQPAPISTASVTVPADAWALVDSKAITKDAVARRSKLLGLPEGAALEVLVRERILEDALDREGFGPASVSADEIAKARDELRARAKAFGQDLDAELAKEGKTVADLDPALRLDRAFRHRIEKDATEDALRAAFEKQKLALAGECRATVVVCSTRAGENAAFQRASALLAVVTPDGANLPGIARGSSDDPMAPLTSGDTDFFPLEPRGHSPRIEPAIARAAFDLGRPGLVPFPVRTRDAYCIVFVTATRFTTEPSFPDLRAKVRDRFLAERASELFERWRADAKVVKAPGAPAVPEGFPLGR